MLYYIRVTYKIWKISFQLFINNLWKNFFYFTWFRKHWAGSSESYSDNKLLSDSSSESYAMPLSQSSHRSFDGSSWSAPAIFLYKPLLLSKNPLLSRLAYFSRISTRGCFWKSFLMIIGFPKNNSPNITLFRNVKNARMALKHLCKFLRQWQ